MSALHLESANNGGTAVGAADVLVRHAHYYDAALHRAITETGVNTGRRAVERAAASAAFRALSGTLGSDAATALHELFTSTGLGAIQSCEVGPKQGEISVALSGYVRARLEMFGKASAPACDVSRGVIAGAMGALFGSAFTVRETECVAAGAKRCRFVAEAADDGGSVDVLPGFEWKERGPAPPAEESGDSEHLMRALAADGPTLEGPGYGRLWAELYARAAHEFEQEIPRTMGPKFGNLASVVLTEAAHLGTFYSVGGLIRAPEWAARVVPVLPTREEWVRAIVGLVESFGWGSWRIMLLAPDQRFTVQVYDGYEALAYLGLEQNLAATPRCYFARGFVAALMNVVFAGDILAPPVLSQSVYNSLFRSLSSFRAIETRCVAMGDPFCEFVANPLSPGMRRR